MIEVNKISYKTVSKAELGLSKSHMTHIGFAENTFMKLLPDILPQLGTL